MRCSTFLPLASDLDKVDADPVAPASRAALGRRGASRRSTDLVEAEPVLVRISAAKRLRDAAERDARQAGEERVGIDRLPLPAGKARQAEPA